MEFQRIQGKIYRIFIRVNKKDFLTLIRKSFLLFIFLEKKKYHFARTRRSATSFYVEGLGISPGW